MTPGMAFASIEAPGLAQFGRIEPNLLSDSPIGVIRRWRAAKASSNDTSGVIRQDRNGIRQGRNGIREDGTESDTAGTESGRAGN